MKIEELIQQTLQQVFHDDAIVFDKSRFAGGLTNYNYIMTIHGCDYVVRQPGGLTEQMIDRKAEQVNNELTSEFGVNCDCIYFDAASGIKISVYVPNSKNMAQAGPDTPEHIRIVSSLIKQVHAMPEPLSNHFDWFTELTKYENLIRKIHGEFFFDYLSLKNRLMAFVTTHVHHKLSTPCHNDTVPENFLINDKGLAYLIDWEYAGMNDPCWDVAAYMLESRLPAEAITYLARDYFGRDMTIREEMKIKSFMLEQDLLWTAWALLRHYNGDDFLEYCDLRYDRLRKNMKNLEISDYFPLSEMVK
jgi:thiamine kinase-like enzyme